MYTCRGSLAATLLVADSGAARTTSADDYVGMVVAPSSLALAAPRANMMVLATGSMMPLGVVTDVVRDCGTETVSGTVYRVIDVTLALPGERAFARFSATVAAGSARVCGVGGTAGECVGITPLSTGTVHAYTVGYMVEEGVEIAGDLVEIVVQPGLVPVAA